MVVPTGSRYRRGCKGTPFPIQNLMASRKWDRMAVHTAEPGDHVYRDRAIAARYQRQPAGCQLVGDRGGTWRAIVTTAARLRATALRGIPIGDRADACVPSRAGQRPIPLLQSPKSRRVTEWLGRALADHRSGRPLELAA
jgi:hypothetical protein